MQGKWERRTGKYQTGENYRVGKIIVGYAAYYDFRSKGDPITYVCHCDLPGIKQAETKYATIEEAKARLERMVRAWFEWVQE